MAKQLWKPSTILNPVPVVMVSCCGREGKPNIITVAWAGTINSKPPMVSISIRKERYSYNLIKEKGQFVINLTTRKLAFAADFCGVKSGRDVDKFEVLKLTQEKASVVDVPMIKESPVNIECTVKDIIELGSHDMFIAQIEAVSVDESLIDKKGGCAWRKRILYAIPWRILVFGKDIGIFWIFDNQRKEVLKRRLNKKDR